jgi:hypothetical protein
MNPHVQCIVDEVVDTRVLAAGVAHAAILQGIGAGFDQIDWSKEIT